MSYVDFIDKTNFTIDSFSTGKTIWFDFFEPFSWAVQSGTVCDVEGVITCSTSHIIARCTATGFTTTLTGGDMMIAVDVLPQRHRLLRDVPPR